MAFDKRRAGYLDELRVLSELFDIGHTAVTHTASETAHKLEYDFRERTSVRYATFDAFRDKFFRVGLEISVLATCSHCAERAHASVNLETSALEHFDLSGSFFRARKKTTYHDGACACADSLYDIAGEFDTAVRYYALAVFVSHFGALHDGGELRHTDARHDARRADRTGPDADFDDVRARPTM